MDTLTQTNLLAAALVAGLAPTKPQLSTAPAEKAMASRATWKGVLSFSALSMNVKTYKATDQEEVKLNMIHACNHAEIEKAQADNQAAIDKLVAAGKDPAKAKLVTVPEPTFNQLKRSGMKCPVCNEEVEQALKGFQYEEGHFVVVSEEAKKACQVAHSDAMPIQKFVDINEIDPIYFAASEFIAPDKGFEIPFAILRQAMVEQNTVALASTSQRGRQETVVLRPYGDEGGMIVNYLYFDNEVRGFDKWTKVNLDGANAQLVDIATQLIQNMTGTFNPTDYEDTSMRQYKGLLNDLVDGKGVTTPILTAPAAPDKKQDLMSQLMASLSLTGTSKAKGATA